MRKRLEFFCFVILPIMILILFILIGVINMDSIHAEEGAHLTMSGSIELFTWIYRGVYSMLLIIAFSFVFYSKTSNIGKVFVFLLVLVFNIPIICFMEYLVIFPNLLLIIPIVNIFAFIPLVLKKNFDKNNLKE